jgi:hypothetical protein
MRAVSSVDEPRFLARGPGYVRSSTIAMDGLECVDEGEQTRQTRQARLGRERQQREAWQRARGQIGSAIARFEEEAHPDRRLRQAMHMIGAGVGRVDRELGLS